MKESEQEVNKFKTIFHCLELTCGQYAEYMKTGRFTRKRQKSKKVKGKQDIYEVEHKRIPKRITIQTLKRNETS